MLVNEYTRVSVSVSMSASICVIFFSGAGYRAGGGVASERHVPGRDRAVQAGGST